MLLLVGCALFFSLAATADAQAMTFIGKVVQVDKEAKAVEVHPFNNALAGHMFVLSDDIAITKDDMPVDFKDINVGDMVSVTYHLGSNDLNIIDHIAITSGSEEQV